MASPVKQSAIEEVARTIAERFSPEKIILFGSQARGDSDPASDIDLLVLFADLEESRRRTAAMYLAVRKFLLPVEIVVSSVRRFERYKNVVNTVFWPAAREGRVLYERAA